MDVGSSEGKVAAGVAVGLAGAHRSITAFKEAVLIRSVRGDLSTLGGRESPPGGGGEEEAFGGGGVHGRGGGGLRRVGGLEELDVERQG